MTVKRYFAATARDCLRKVKEDLGPDAIVVSNKSVRGGIELTAMSADSLDEISSRAGATEHVEERLVAAGGARHGFASAASDDYTVSLSAQSRSRVTRPSATPGSHMPQMPHAPLVANDQPNKPVISAWQPPRYETSGGQLAPVAPAAATMPAAAAKSAAFVASPSSSSASATSARAEAEPAPRLNARAPAVDDLAREMQDIRNLLEQQLAGFAWGEMSRASPTRAQLMTELLEMGFSGVLARRLTQDVQPSMSPEEGRRHMAAILDRRLRLHDADNDLIHRGGVYALVGPTGVGKTTTTAKLAARCVVRYGADRVALLTTDGYRIGAHEQLRIYGRILGVPVHAVGDSNDLRQTLAALKDKHMVLIDTVGMSQRDRMVLEQASMLASSGEVKRLLLLNATSRGETLDDVIRSYGGEDIAACIVSKVDETTTLAPVVDAVVRHGMPIAYLANGQRVPEDMHLPNRQYLLHRVFKQAQGNMAHRLKPEEIGMAMAGSAGLHDRDHGQGG